MGVINRVHLKIIFGCITNNSHIISSAINNKKYNNSTLCVAQTIIHKRMIWFKTRSKTYSIVITIIVIENDT